MPQEAFKFYDDANPSLNTSFYGVEHQLCFTNLLTPEDFMKGLNLRLPNLDHFLPFIQSLFMQKKDFFLYERGRRPFLRNWKVLRPGRFFIATAVKGLDHSFADRYLRSPKTSSASC